MSEKTSEVPLVSIIIPHHINLAQLEVCLASLKNLTYPNFEIILVDNNSATDLGQYVKQAYLNIKLVKNKENLGYAYANNIGAKYANGKYILFLNDDTKVKPDFLEPLIAKMENNPSIGIVQSKLLQMNEEKKFDIIGGYLTRIGFLRPICLEGEEDKGQYDKIEEIFSPRGASIMTNRDLFNELGGFDNDFFAYFEETDFAWRVWLAGYKVIFVPESVVYHKGGGTTQSLPFCFIQYHSFKNRICSLIKNLESKNLFLNLSLHLCLCFALVLVSSLCLKHKRVRVVLNAIYWNIKHFNTTLQKRRIIQYQIRKIRDRDIFFHVGARVPFIQFWHSTKWFINKD